jgi:hypothetical protein
VDHDSCGVITAIQNQLSSATPYKPRKKHMTERSQQAAIINDHQGEAIELSTKKTARVRPFTVEELLVDEIDDAANTILSTLLNQALAVGRDPNLENVSKLYLMGLFRSCKKEVGICLPICVDLPLAQIPGPELPRIMGAFVRQNFQYAQTQSWADVMKTLLTAIRGDAGGKSSGSTLETPANSSSTTATPAGGSTPAPSSNTGSGGA